jgi:hypothetical protein
MYARSFEPAGLLKFGTSKVVESVKWTTAGKKLLMLVKL